MSNTTTALATLPTVPAAPANTVDDSRTGTPYVRFVSTKSPSYGQLVQQLPGIREADAVLIRPEPERPIKLDPFKFHLLAASQYWIEAEEDGTLIRVVTMRPEERDPSLKEAVEAVILAYAGGKILPARVTFKTTKAPAAITAYKALKLAASPAWAEQSPEHAASLRAPLPFARFTATVTTTARTSRSSGFKYWLAEARITPTTAGELELLSATAQDAVFTAALARVIDSYNRRNAELLAAV